MNQGQPTRIPWRPIEPLPETDIPENGALGALNALRDEWERRLNALPEEERARIRQRSLRKLAIETGILERLYDVDWGLTLTLVAEGFTRDVVERAGGRLDERTLATLRVQMDSLAMVLDFVKSDRLLSSSFIKELHHALTRTQDTYEVTDSLGRLVTAPLPKGEWKQQPNHVIRSNNTLLEYTPPEHVAAEIDRLIEYWRAIDAGPVHAIIKLAWLHHRFVQIHPFADGNGRVARALTLLVAEKHRFAPLVVDRWHRKAYLSALDAANDGNLRDLIKLFINLEGAALASELERPPEHEEKGFAVDVAHTLAAQLVEARRRQAAQVDAQLKARAVAIAGRIEAWFKGKRGELKEVFEQRKLRDVKVLFRTAFPPDEKTFWYRWQVTESAHLAGHYADFKTYSGWTDLRIQVEGWQLRFVASLHGAGKEPGVLAVTSFGEIEPYPAPGEEQRGPERRQQIQTTTDAFRFVHSEPVSDLEKRAKELEELLDEGLAVALAELIAKA